MTVSTVKLWQSVINEHGETISRAVDVEDHSEGTICDMTGDSIFECSSRLVAGISGYGEVPISKATNFPGASRFADTTKKDDETETV